MTLQIAAGPSGLLEQRRHRFATLHRIDRTDGVRFLFCSAPTAIEFGGLTYQPSGGLSLSARRKQAGLQPQNVEARGVISSADVTVKDLSEHRFDEALVTETLVDWEYSWTEPFKVTKYWVTEITWDGERWTAQLEGQTRWLRNNVGRVFTRNCGHDVGDGFSSGRGCTVDIGALRVVNTTVNTVDSTENRRKFTGLTGAFAAGLGDDYFKHGRVMWISGANAGLVGEVRRYVNSTRGFELFLPMPNVIAASDRFTAEPGCDWTRPTCIARFNNIEDYVGFPSMPGTKAIVQKARR